VLHVTDATLYLPLSDPLLDSILDESRPLEESVSGLAVPQLAALLVMQGLGTSTSVPTPGRMLAELISLGNQWVRQAGPPAFVAQTLTALDRAKLRAGRECLLRCGVVLLAHEDLAHRSYLTGDEEWDSGFNDRHREWLQRTVTRVAMPDGQIRMLTPEQGQVFREAEAASDEHLHVQGYAGTGKSHLIASLLAMLVAKGAVIALVAERRTQLEALEKRIGKVEGVHPMTFGGLMDEVIPPDLSDPGAMRMRHRDRSQAMPSDESLARYLGVHAGGGLSAAGIAGIARGIVGAFCRSDAPEIDSGHVPLGAPALDSATRLVVLHHATELWKATVEPTSREFRPPVRDYHRIKWAALNGLQIPARFTHVLMDECHDLPRPLLQLVERSPQAVITLGDEYQNLQARPQYRGPGVRERRFTKSVRSGQVIEDIVNPIIGSHPGRTKLPFQGSPFSQLEIFYYDKVEVPVGPLVVLVNDEWGLFEWSQRLAEKGEFALLSSRQGFDMFVSDCIELHQHRTRPRHGALYRYSTWESVAAGNSDNPGFKRIDRMLAKGYSGRDWARTLERAQGGPGTPMLGMVGDVRNKEFANVLLVPDVVDWAWRARQSSRAETGSAIYVAVTRAQERLYLPRRLQAWIEDL
jgi:hypothetical protein